MKKLVIFSMAIIAFVLLAISLVPLLFLEHGDRLVWQLSNWAWIFASLLIAIIGVMLTIHYSKGKHILWKITGWLGCMATGVVNTTESHPTDVSVTVVEHWMFASTGASPPTYTLTE